MTPTGTPPQNPIIIMWQNNRKTICDFIQNLGKYQFFSQVVPLSFQDQQQPAIKYRALSSKVHNSAETQFMTDLQH